MAVIEVCDICRKEVSETNGVTLDCSDMEGLGFNGYDPCRATNAKRILLSIARRM